MTAARTRDPLGDFSKHPKLGRYDDPHLYDWTRRSFSIASEQDGNENSYWPRPANDGYFGEVPADYLYPLQHDYFWSRHGLWIAGDLRWRYSLTPGFLDGVVAFDLSSTLDEGKTAEHLTGVVMAELAARKLPIRDTLQVHMLMALTSPNRTAREAGIDLFVQASDDGRLAKAITGCGLILRQILSGKIEYLTKDYDCTRFVTSLRKFPNGSPLLQRQMRDILLVALNDPHEEIPRGFSSLLEILHELIISHPMDSKLDLNEMWGGSLTGKAKTLAAKIAKL